MYQSYVKGYVKGYVKAAPGLRPMHPEVLERLVPGGQGARHMVDFSRAACTERRLAGDR